MLSIVWTGDRTPTQPWGWTTVTAEPWYDAGNFSGYFHCGIDIPMDTGEPICAARAGIVLAVGPGFLVIRVGSETDWYLHGSSYVVRVGQAVERGRLIGYAGDVAPPGGTSFGSHLHFERQSTLALYCNIPATSRDPIPVLEGAFMATRADSPELFSMLDLLQLGIFGKEASNSTGLQRDVANVKQQTDLLQMGIFGKGANNATGLQADVAAVLAAVKAIQAGVVDLKPVLDALAKIQAKLDKHLV
jgi:hypothetical protein